MNQARNRSRSVQLSELSSLMSELPRNDNSHTHGEEEEKHPGPRSPEKDGSEEGARRKRSNLLTGSGVTTLPLQSNSDED